MHCQLLFFEKSSVPVKKESHIVFDGDFISNTQLNLKINATAYLHICGETITKLIGKH